MRVRHKSHFKLLLAFGIVILLLNFFLTTKKNENNQEIRKGARAPSKPIAPLKPKLSKITRATSIRKENEDFEAAFKIAKQQLSSEYQSLRLQGDPNFKLLFPVPNSSMKRILIISSWRSGSSFTGGTFGAYPGAFYMGEPLHPVGIRYVKEGREEERAIRFLREVMTCNVKSYQDFFNYYSRRNFLIESNLRYWNACKINRDICFQQELFNQICRLMPINVMKVIRLKVQQITDLIEDPDLNLKVIHLIRDPRSTLLSRRKDKWCTEKKECIDPKSFCLLLKKDLDAARMFSRKFPEKFLQIRYEDIATQSHETIKMMLKFVGLSYIEEMKAYVENHTNGQHTKQMRNSLNSTANAFKWRKIHDFKDMSAIQEICSSVIKSLNFRIFKNEEEYKDESLSVFL